jgi:hypothetical protein
MVSLWFPKIWPGIFMLPATLQLATLLGWGDDGLAKISFQWMAKLSFPGHIEGDNPSVQSVA